MSNLKGKSAIVTGGSPGLGLGVTRRLLSEGVRVWVVARDAAHLARLEKEPPGVRTIAADVTDEATAPRVLKEARPDVLVLCAGATPHMGKLTEQTWEQFERAWQTDVSLYQSRTAFAPARRQYGSDGSERRGHRRFTHLWRIRGNEAHAVVPDPAAGC